MSAELDALKAALVHNTAVTANAVAVIADLRNQIQALSTSGDTAALPNLTALVSANDAALDAAVNPVVAADVPAAPTTP